MFLTIFDLQTGNICKKNIFYLQIQCIYASTYRDFCYVCRFKIDEQPNIIVFENDLVIILRNIHFNRLSFNRIPIHIPITNDQPVQKSLENVHMQRLQYNLRLNDSGCQ